MAYGIYKHRRGTTEELLNSNLVPEEGELIIEECSNGARKGKVGDGIHVFKDLVYLDADTRSQLLAKLANVEKTLNEKLTAASDEQAEQLNKLRGDLTELIFGISNTAADSIGKIEETKIFLQELIKESYQKNKTEISVAKKSIEQKLADSEEKQTNDLTRINHELKMADSELDKNISQLKLDTEAQAAEVLKQLEDLYEKAANLTENDVDLITKIYAVENTTTGLIKSLTADLSDTKQKHTADIAKLTNNISTITAKQLSDKAELLDLVNEHLTKIYEELEELVDHDVALITKIYAVENTLTAKVNTISSTVDSKFNTANKAIQKLTAELQESKTESANDFTEIKADILKNKDAADLAIANISKQVESASAELFEAVDKIDNTKQSLLENIETLRSSTNIKFNDTQKSLNQATSALQNHKEEVLNKFEEVLAKAQTDKEELSAAIRETADTVAQVNTKIEQTNTELKTQTSRINNLIKLEPGSTTGDAELADIRSGYNGLVYESAGDAVRAIGNDLDELKNSLPEYIPANAVDGLLYEGNLLYLTSDGVPVSDPVEIKGGSGGGSASIVKITNNLHTNSFTVAKGNDAWIDFTYTSFENEVPTGDGMCSIIVNNKTIDKLSGSIHHSVAKRINVAEYLKNGTNTIKVTCTDQYGTARSLVYNISLIELRIESSFDSTRVYDDLITFRYKVYGQIEKTAYVFIDDVEFSSKKLSASVSGGETTLTIPKQAHGCHKITAYISASIDGDEIRSNILEYEIIYIEADDTEKAAVLASVYSINKVTQGDLISIPYMLYDPSEIACSTELIIYSQVAGERIEVERSSLTVNRSLQYWKTRKYPVGKTIFVISYTYSLYGVETTITKEHVVDVEALEVDIKAEEDSLQLFLSAQGRSNNETDPAIWTFTPENDGVQVFDKVTTTFENFNWKSNGWVTDDSGDTCLRLNGDARAIINFKPFKDDFKNYGKTIEFEFAVRDVNSREAVVINCFDGDRGFQATPDTAFLKSSGTQVSCRYKDEERIRVAVSVEHADSSSRFVSIYLDGILSGVQRYATTDIFSQQNPLNIIIGSNLCGVDIYTIRVYSKALSTSQLLANYIADMSEPAAKLKLVTDNEILDENDKVSYDRVKALGQIPIITFTGQMPTYKGDKKKKSVRMKFEDPVNPELNFDVLLDQIDVQGTSSQFYIRKNWKVKLPEARAHMPGAIPAKVFCIKVDYAEATGTHNTGTANYAETFYDREAVTLPPQKDDTRVRTTIQGFPIIIFEKETEDSEPVFSSKGNFNYDKDAENAFGFTKDYDGFGVECWEFCNNTSNPVNFAGEIPTSWQDDFEPRYVPESANFERIEELLEIQELAAKGQGAMTDAQRQELIKLQTECIANFKEMHDWVRSTATYSLVDGKRVPIEAEEAQRRLDKFKSEFTQHFNMHYCCIYYVYTFFALMTDQRAKNLFLTRWKDSDGVHRWYPYFYDNDTIFGINNEGALVFDYFHEDVDQLGSSNVYNGQNSVFWNNFRECFPQEIQSAYAKLRSDKKLTYESIINQYVTLGSDKWSAAIYNADADYKYVSMAREAIEHKDEEGNTVTEIDASNLYQVRGPGEHHLRYFIANRLNYCDSKWNAGSYPSDTIFLRIYTPKPGENATQEEIDRINNSLQAVPADPSITITPFSNMYAGVKYGANGTMQQERLSSNHAFTFTPPSAETFNDTETAIFGAGEISSLGDLAGLYCGVINLSKASKLVELKIGNEHPDYYNDNFREISVGSNRLLRTIDLRNCSGLGIAGKSPQKTLDLSGCPNIENIYTEGTNLELVELPESGYVKVLHLPASTSTLVIKNQKYITDLSIASYTNIKTLIIENCPTLNTNEILDACKKADGSYYVERVRLTGINWELENADFVKSLFPRFDTEGNILGGIRGIDEKNNTIDDAYLVGTCHISKLTGVEYAEIKSHYPYLDITFDEMTSSVVFMSTNGEAELYRTTVTCINSTAMDCSDPVIDKLIDEPTKESTAEFDYSWAGWSRKVGGEPHQDALLAITGDRVLYPAFAAIRRKYEIRFINQTLKDNSLLQTALVEYGSDAVYSGQTPTKQDAGTPDLYTFTGWYPKPEKITGPMTCYAQFTILDDKWYTIGIGDISDCIDPYGKLFDGFTLNNSDMTMNITECNNDYNAAVKVPNSLTFENGAFNVVALGGFSRHKKLELIAIPETVRTILARAFEECTNLLEITLPKTLNTIGASAFQGCSKIKEFFIPATVVNIGSAAFANCKNLINIVVDDANTRYTIINNCLVDRQTKTLIQGLTSSEIPTDGSVVELGQYCFAGKPITSINIPANITAIADNAFSNCTQLQEVTLPNTIKILNATCFAWCSNLTSIDLPEGLTEIRTYVFDACALEDIVIPSSVNRLLARSFGDMPSLKTVTFRRRVDESGAVIVPNIEHSAFINSGSASAPLVFNLPWTKEQHEDMFTGTYTDATGVTYDKDVFFGAKNGTVLRFIDESGNVIEEVTKDV